MEFVLYGIQYVCAVKMHFQIYLVFNSDYRESAQGIRATYRAIDPSGQWKFFLRHYVNHTVSVMSHMHILCAEKPEPVLFQDCGADITASNGTIESPGYPDGYPGNSNCVWNIQVPSNNGRIKWRLLYEEVSVTKHVCITISGSINNSCSNDAATDDCDTYYYILTDQVYTTFRESKNCRKLVYINGLFNIAGGKAGSGDCKRPPEQQHKIA